MADPKLRVFGLVSGASVRPRVRIKGKSRFRFFDRALLPVWCFLEPLAYGYIKRGA
jgi:hypothetical protein